MQSRVAVVSRKDTHHIRNSRTKPKTLNEPSESKRTKFDEFAAKTGIKVQRDWYKVTKSHIHNYFGRKLSFHGLSLSDTLSRVYPEYNWHSWLFESSPQKLQRTQHRKYLDWLAEELALETHQQLCALTYEDFISRNGSSLLASYSYSIRDALKSAFPEFEWFPLFFVHSTERHFLDWIAFQKDVQTQSDWYRIDLEQHFPRSTSPGLLTEALQRCYPEFDWFECLFDSHFKFTRQTFDWLSYELDIQSQQEWYAIQQHLDKSGNQHLGGLLGSLSSILVTLKKVYPEFEWNIWQFLNSSHQLQSASDYRSLFDWMHYELQLETQEDWYSVDFDSLDLHIQFSRHSAIQHLQQAYPEYEWDAQLFIDSLTSLQQDLDWLALKCGIQTQSDWYHISNKVLLQHANTAAYTSVMSALMHGYPQYIWHGWLFSKCAESSQFQPREYLDWLAYELGIERQEDWYQYTVQDFNEMSSVDLQTFIFKSDSSNALKRAFPEYILLKTCYPEFDWNFNRFLHRSLREYLDEFSVEIGIGSQSDWYAVQPSKLTGIAIFNSHSPLDAALVSAYPEFDWHPWLFLHCENDIICNLSNQKRKFLDWLAGELDVEVQEDWYSITTEDVLQNHGETLLKNDPLNTVLQRVYPQYEWRMWLFKHLPAPYGFWSSTAQLRKFMEWASELLHIEDKEDWSSVSIQTIHELGGYGFIEHYGSLVQMLEAAFAHSFYPIHTSRGQSTTLQHLQHILGEQHEIRMNYRFNQPTVELDLYIPSLSLAFEYQGEQHYAPAFSQTSSHAQRERDINKKKVCMERGITLIEIPFWWNNNMNSLLSTIHAKAQAQLPITLPNMEERVDENSSPQHFDIN